MGANQPDPGSGSVSWNWLEELSLRDLISSRDHSRDFNQLRAAYIAVRIRLLAAIFAVLAPFWIPIDWYLLSASEFEAILPLRLAFAVGFLLLALWHARPESIGLARLRLLLFLAIPAIFYLVTRLAIVLPEEALLVGYAFLPFLMVALLAVFPLTVLEGVIAALLIGALLIVVELSLATLLTLPVLADIWLLGLLALIALWVGLTQLNMLLRLYRGATRDPLTRLVNRRMLAKWLELEVAAAQESGQPLSVLLFDLDYFKRINDVHGHITGDAVLRAFGGLLAEEFKRSHLGRYSGEEFLAILPGADSAGAMTAAERLRKACHRLEIRGPGGEPVRVTTSIGVAQLRAGENGESLLRRVDRSLEQAKASGRDLVAIAE